MIKDKTDVTDSKLIDDVLPRAERVYQPSATCSEEEEKITKPPRRPNQSAKQLGRALINQLSNLGAPLSISKAKFYHLHTSSGLSPSTSHSLGLPPSSLSQQLIFPPPSHQGQRDPHTPPPLLSMVSSDAASWPRYGHLEISQTVRLKSGS